MKCGHAANAVNTETNTPVCVICIGLTQGADEIDEAPPDLTGRRASCAYCKREAPSSTNLPFFSVKLHAATDDYYDGCFGWD